MRHTKLFILLAFMSLVFTTCKEDIDTFIVEEETLLTRGNIVNFFTEMHTGTAIHLFNGNESTTIVTPRRTNIQIPPNAFVDDSGTVVTGPIQFELIEIYEKGDMIKFNRPTSSNGRPLTSSGAFYLQANQGNKVLSLSPNHEIQIRIESETINPKMELFYGDDTDPSGFNWVEADGNSQLWENVNSDSWDNPDGTVGTGYSFSITQLNWINCDAFVDINPDALTALCVELPELYTNKNAVVFVTFEDWNGVMPLRGSPDSKQFCEIGLPVGATVKLLVISEQGTDNYHFANHSLTITENQTEIMEPIPTTLESIVEVLDEL